ncbi:hypothetical protein ACP2W0_15085 [Pseudobacillus badius]|uniref:hypothetical protein n=1 Tax=Bacillus badius TaxID=1455 RepID=UPI0007B0443D|nr:hypothetical protein [Bacillus badius]KZN98155.1 hypothetical protein A4244_11290 [Bacillus badius]MED0665424.1 hypothetical protein [Bacillus badius]OCS82418.1 hypothetical protein A6M11_11300 [Bacillus badius]OVE50936.1 hypothetical protein B1A98_14060 [Bacillus badius]TDW01738.1 hypothetical protein B0G66_10914 [Bacillus badius]
MAEEKKERLQKGKMDNPEQMKTDKESLYDKFKSEQTVDSLPLEDLRMEQEEEKDKHATKDNSSSEEKFPG